MYTCIYTITIRAERDHGCKGDHDWVCRHVGREEKGWENKTKI